MKRTPITVKIVFSGQFKLNLDAASFSILTLNKIQNMFEFEIFEEEKDFLDYDENAIISSFAKYLKKKRWEGNCYYICITEREILNNWFHATQEHYSIITLHDWKKAYSPPSYIEYIINSIADCLVHDMAGLESHDETRGCILDYTEQKTQLRWGIPLGCICKSCEEQMLKKSSKEFVEVIKNIVSFEWLGNVATVGTPAYKLKKYYRFDIDKDTGLEKSFFEKANERFVDSPKEIFVGVLLLIIGYLLGARYP